MQNTITEGLHIRKIGGNIKIMSCRVPTFHLFRIPALSYPLLYESN